MKFFSADRICLNLFVVFTGIVLLSESLSAETVTLKSGQQVEGRIIEKNDDSVKVEVVGMPVTYFLDEIETIDGQPVFRQQTEILTDDRSAEANEDQSEPVTSVPEVIQEALVSQETVVFQDGKLWIKKELPDGSVVGSEPYIIKGISWNPATMAPDTGPNPLNPFNPSEYVPYGFFFDWEGRKPQGHECFNYWVRGQFAQHYKEDIPLLKELNVNTVRVYTDFGLNNQIFNPILDELYKNGIRVILTVASSKKELESGRYLDVVRAYRDHPAILMWSLGNEWNLDINKFWGYARVADAAEAVNQAAVEIKKIDSDRAVCSVLGDRFTDPDPKNTIADTLGRCPDVDIWGLNIYRGKSFGDLFSRWKQVSSKPFFISEYGTDSFQTTAYQVTCDGKAYDCQGQENEQMQADLVASLYKELRSHVSSPENRCLGGLVNEFNDELWKVGSYHALLGGVVDYKDPAENTCYRRYDTQGACLKGSHPDDVANEEYFGVVTANRQPKKTYEQLRRLYQE